MLNSVSLPRCLVGLLVLSGSVLQAQQQLIIAPMSNVKSSEVSSLSGECTMIAGRQLSCDFLQTGVGLERRPEEVPTELEKMMKEFTAEAMPKIKEYLGETCTSDSLAKFRTSAASPQLSATAKSFLLRLIERTVAVCERPTRENLSEWFRLSLEKESRTCKIWTNRFRETFSSETVAGGW